MNLLSFRTPAFYAACHRCGNALTHGEEECPHCGTNQSRALRAPNSVDFDNSAVMLMPGRMFVPYPSVPEEVDAAMNIARERARVVRRLAFGVAGGGLLAVALALNYAPGLRSPVVQRLAALPEPARTPAFVPVITNNAPKAAAPVSTTTIAAAAKPAKPVSVSAPTPPVVAPPEVTLATPPAVTLTTPPALTHATPPAVTLTTPPALTLATPPAVTLTTPPALTLATPPAVTLTTPPALTLATPPALAQTPTQTAPQASSPGPSPAATLAPAMNQATEMIASIMNKLTTAAAALRAEISTLTMSPAASPVTTATSIAPPPVTAPTAITATTTSNETNAPSRIAAPEPKSPTAGPSVTVAQGPVVAPAADRSPPQAPITLAQNTATTPPPTNATTAQSPAPVISTPPAPSPGAVADVPVASHAPQPSAPVEKELPKLSLPPVLPVIATERPPVGSPGESLYFARLALATNDLSAAQKNLANVPANQVNSPEVQRIRDDLAQREAARDTAMQHARACDRSASWRCARRYAKDALAIDSTYTDSRVFLKYVSIKIAEAKKAAESARIQNAAIAQRGPLHPAPIREAVVIPRVAPVASTPAVPRTAPVATTGSVPATTGSAPPHLFANPIARAPRETHVTHEAHETRVASEMGEPVVAFQLVRTADTASMSKSPDDNTPIRPAGRGEAH
jgi:hypothetical protein